MFKRHHRSEESSGEREAQRPDDADLRRRLTPQQYKVTQRDGTEPAFANEYWDEHRDGIYVDVVSGEPLFSSQDKYDSGTGWPSFTQPHRARQRAHETDVKLVMPRTEVRSAVCGLAPRPRLQRRPRADGPALLHELVGVSLHPPGAAGAGRLRRVREAVRRRTVDGRGLTGLTVPAHAGRRSVRQTSAAGGGRDDKRGGRMLRELAEKVRSRETSAVELVERAYQRIETLDPQLNAVIGLRDPGRALAEASELDQRGRRDAGSVPSPASPSSSRTTRTWPACRPGTARCCWQDAPPAGATASTSRGCGPPAPIPIGKTNVPEFCFEGFTDNRLFGATLNPWAPRVVARRLQRRLRRRHGRRHGPLRDGDRRRRLGAHPRLVLRPVRPQADQRPHRPRGRARLAGLHHRRAARALHGRPAAAAAGVRPARRSAAMPASLAARMLGRRVLCAGGLRRAAVRRARGAALRRLGPAAESRSADLFDAALTSLEKDLGLRVEPLAPAQIFGRRNVDEDWYLTASCEQAHELGAEADRGRASAPAPGLPRGDAVRPRGDVDDYLAARRRRFAYVRALDELLGTRPRARHADHAGHRLHSPTVATGSCASFGLLGSKSGKETIATISPVRTLETIPEAALA